VAAFPRPLAFPVYVDVHGTTTLQFPKRQRWYAVRPVRDALTESMVVDVMLGDS
jgi:hypothetical protein